MAEPLANPTDAAICRLLAGGPLPTAAIADRLALPERTARYRLGRLRQAGTVITGIDRLHRLAGVAPAVRAADGADLAAIGAAEPTATARDDGEPDDPRIEHSAPVDGYQTALMILAAAGIGLIAVVILRGPPDPPTESPPPYGYAGGWDPGPSW